MKFSDPQKRTRLLKLLTNEEADLLRTEFLFRPGAGQQPPGFSERDWSTWVFMGGRGAGKTRAGAEWIQFVVATSKERLRVALVAETYADARMTMIEGVSGLLNVGAHHERAIYLPSLRELRWPNGSIAQIFSSEDPEGLRGPQFHVAWSDEVGKWRHGEETWAMLQMGLRLGKCPRQAVTTTPRPVKHLRAILADPRTAVTRASSYDNRANLAPTFFDHIVKRYEGTQLGRQELRGELIEEIEGTLFKRADIERARVQEIRGGVHRIVVAVDPPVTTGDDADECGIIVAGEIEGFAYVLADRSVQGLSPLGWAERVAAAAAEFDADRVVVEVNQGGDLVEAVLRQIEPNLSVRKVTATRAKFVRAEPVAALYERGRVHHVGMFAELEDQMASFTGDSGRRDDRLDALVWALTDLLLREKEPEPRVRAV